MIVDLRRFVTAGRPLWSELERSLDRLERDPDAARPLADLERLFYLYERSASDLARLSSFAAPPEVRSYLERLVGRAYAEIHEQRGLPRGLSPRRFLVESFPRVFRRRFRAFALAAATTVVGALFGVGALVFDPESKPVLMPFAHLLGDPSERVREEESGSGSDRLEGAQARFSAQLMTHNTRVGIFALALGMTWGIGTLVLLFHNGVILGAVAVDYLAAGEGTFLAGWLLPHGAIEIPAILVAGQAGLVLAGALLGRGSRASLATRMREVGSDLVVLVGGFGVMLIWAGLVESFLSQYHEPRLPYAAKIAFGVVELVLLALWLGRAGRGEGRAP